MLLVEHKQANQGSELLELVDSKEVGPKQFFELIIHQQLWELWQETAMPLLKMDRFEGSHIMNHYRNSKDVQARVS